MHQFDQVLGEAPSLLLDLVQQRLAKLPLEPTLQASHQR
jgi:hypothetical protein